jgi:hypothetical protein
LATFDDCILRLYQGRLKVVEQISTTETGPGGEQDSRVISGRVESVLFSTSSGVSQEEVQKKPLLGTTQ